MLIKFRALAVAGVAAASMLTVGAGAAFAGTTPAPFPTQPTVTPLPVTCTARPITFAPVPDQSLPGTGIPDQGLPSDQPSADQSLPGTGYPSHVRPTVAPPIVTPTPTPQCAPEQFVAQLTAVGNVVVQNRVIANGPVAGTGSLDLAAQTNTFDRALLPGLFRSVNILHTGLAFPSVNLRLCVAQVSQLGLWRFAGGQGLFRRAIGNGTFLLTGQWVFPTIRGVCSLSLLSGNPLLQNRIQPRYTSIQVWATGLARR